MIVKGITYEDFVNYKTPALYISTARCSFKCDKENRENCCQNSSLAKTPDIDIDIKTIISRYINNPITKAIVFGGLEPMDQFNDIEQFIKMLRIGFGCYDDVVIYTGYNRDEIQALVDRLLDYGEIIIKFGRYIPNKPRRYDNILGVTLASDNQYAVKIC